MDAATWRREIEPTLRSRAFATIDHDPMSLFERDGGPEGIKGDLYLARLIGPNDEIIDDKMHLDSARYEVLIPRRVPLTAVASLLEDDVYPTMPTSVYKLQSNWVTMHLAPEHGFDGLNYGPQKLATLVFLRYRRWLDYSTPKKNQP